MELNVRSMEFKRDDEKDSFFIWRDDSLIRKLNQEISSSNAKIFERQKFIETMNQYLLEIYRETEKINLNFCNGRW